jgi:hypothetical protein
MQARVDYHLDDVRLFGFVDSASWPNTKEPLANVEYPIYNQYSTYCDYNYGDPAYKGSATIYLLTNNTAFTNTQQVPQMPACWCRYKRGEPDGSAAQLMAGSRASHVPH